MAGDWVESVKPRVSQTVQVESHEMYQYKEVKAGHVPVTVHDLERPD
jgi:hypothetical protein